jgi:hypothetical protein
VSGSAAPATAAPLVSWRFIHGIVKADDLVLGVINGALILWTTIIGNAAVDLGAGNVQFQVQGLTVAEGDTIGTTGDVTQVFGAIGCPTGGYQFHPGCAAEPARRC